MVHHVVPSAGMFDNRIKEAVINNVLIGIDDGALFKVVKKETANLFLRPMRPDLGADFSPARHPGDGWNFV